MGSSSFPSELLREETTRSATSTTRSASSVGTATRAAVPLTTRPSLPLGGTAAEESAAEGAGARTRRRARRIAALTGFPLIIGSVVGTRISLLGGPAQRTTPTSG
ncbi:MAG TPA: hypothetical protein VF510_02415 [Ktedonobacterales bacterium]